MRIIIESYFIYCFSSQYSVVDVQIIYFTYVIYQPSDLWKYKSVSVLYLQHNKIENVEKLHHIEDLTHLYLQNNNIQTMKGFEALRKLRKLLVSKT
jgi:Leucine-rich repeat (LRR) protein